jgi:hypothetical protein
VLDDILHWISEEAGVHFRRSDGSPEQRPNLLLIGGIAPDAS